MDTLNGICSPRSISRLRMNILPTTRHRSQLVAHGCTNPEHMHDRKGARINTGAIRANVN